MRVVLHDQAVELDYPRSLAHDLERLLGGGDRAGPASTCRIVISEDQDGHFSIAAGAETKRTGFERGEILNLAMDEIVHRLVVDLSSAMAMHAGAVGWRDASILLAGPTGAGKTSLTAWFIDRGFDYITDELVVVPERSTDVTGFPRPLVAKPGSTPVIKSLAAFRQAQCVAAGRNTLIAPATTYHGAATPCRLIIFPRFVADGLLQVRPVSTAEVGLRLMECNLNARNLAAGGFPAVAALARRLPAMEVCYGSFDQLEGALDTIAKFVVEQDVDVNALRRFLSLRNRPAAPTVPAAVTATKTAFPIPAPTPRRSAKTMTIGMATYDDYDGVYFSLQALRLYHPEIMDEVELLVIDNHPDGPCSAALKALDGAIPNLRYVPFAECCGTTVKGEIFGQASGSFVLGIDCHVFVVPGAVRRLLDYFSKQPQSNDLLQGPLVYDDLTNIATHFDPVWSGGMFGRWATDERGRDPDAPPFDIPMQGMGLFACRTEAWPGFNPRFRGFGGEEGYIHEKFRQAGARTLCLPFLRWVHRFNRPMGIPYPNSWDDRLRNYLIGHEELGLPTEDVETHFREILGQGVVDPILSRIRAELARDTDRHARVSTGLESGYKSAAR